MPLTVAEHSQLAVLYLRRAFQHERQGEPALAAALWNLSNDHCNAAVRQLNEGPPPCPGD